MYQSIRFELHVEVFWHLVDDARRKLHYAASDEVKVCLPGHYRGPVCNPVRLVVRDRDSLYARDATEHVNTRV